MDNISITSSFYKNRNLDSNFVNCFHALNMAIESKFASFIYNNDRSRIVYASNEFCFRKRASQLEKDQNNVGNPTWNNIYLPFMNYYLTETSDPTSRPWFCHSALVNGIFVDELGFNLQINPIKLQYEATIWYTSDFDMKFVLVPLYHDNNTESKIEYQVQINDQTLTCLAINKYNITYNPAYKENDWLEKNKIRSIALDFSIDTFLIEGNYDVSIVKEVIFDFLTTKNLPTTYDDPQWNNSKEIIQYFND